MSLPVKIQEFKDKKYIYAAGIAPKCQPYKNRTEESQFAEKKQF